MTLPRARIGSSRLGGLIQLSDTVVFVVSLEAVKSDRCAWEVERALATSKRLLPVIFQPVSDFDIPEQLRRRQFVRFDVGSGITRPLTELAEALRQDIDWIREHTRLGEVADRWEARGRPESLLLRGDDLEEALSWASHWKPGAPEITELMAAFLAASKKTASAYLAKSNAVQRRIIRMQALLSLLLVGVIVGLVGWINQSYIKKQWRWYAISAPYIRAQVLPYLLTAERERDLKALDSFRECAVDCPEMITVPAGKFMMGSPKGLGEDDEYPQHQVVIAHPFAVARADSGHVEA